MRYIYLASSWRNEHQPRIVALLRDAGHQVYDFRNPQQVIFSHTSVPHSEKCSCFRCMSGERVGWPSLGAQVAAGFSWAEIDPDWQTWTPAEYVRALDHLRALEGFRSDFDAMRWCDTCVCLMPCGPSAALEAGWCSGSGRKLIVHVAGMREPDLMYKVADKFTLTDDELLNALRT